MKTVALYARVSTKQHGQDPNTQLLPLREFANSRNFSIVGEYVDVGWSGAKERRPQLDKMMADAKKKKFEGVLVWRFDRFARSTKHLITALGEFGQLGIDFVSMSESIDTSTAMGRLVFTILAAVAEMERALIKERVQAGVDRAKKQGKRLGRPRVLVDEQRVLELVKGGSSVRATAQAVGVDRRTIDAILKRHANKSQSRCAEIPSPDCSVST